MKVVRAVPTESISEKLSVQRLSEALGMRNLRANVFTLAEGSISKHMHREQEEVYLVLDGTAMIDVDQEQFKVGEREALAVPARAWHRQGLALPHLELLLVDVDHGRAVEHEVDLLLLAVHVLRYGALGKREHVGAQVAHAQRFAETLDAELLRDALGGYGTHDFHRPLLDARGWSGVRGAHAALSGPIQPCSSGSTVTGIPQRPSKRAASAAVPTMSPKCMGTTAAAEIIRQASAASAAVMT